MSWIDRKRWNRVRGYVVPTVLLLAAMSWLVLDGQRMRVTQRNKYSLPSDHSPRAMLEFLRKMDGSAQFSDGYFESSNAKSVSEAVRQAYAILQSGQQSLTKEERHEADFYNVYYSGAAFIQRVKSPDDSTAGDFVTKARQFLSSAPSFGSRERQVASLTLHVLESIGNVNDAREFGQWVVNQIDNRPEFSSDVAKNIQQDLLKVVNRLDLMHQIVVLQSTTVGDQPFDLASHRSKVVLIEFWGAHCAPCIADSPALKRIYAAHKDRGFEIVAICLNTAPSRITSLVTEHQLPWIQLCEDKTAGSECNKGLADRFGVEAIPTTLLIDREGRVVAMGVRPLAGDSQRDLERWLAKL